MTDNYTPVTILRWGRIDSWEPVLNKYRIVWWDGRDFFKSRGATERAYDAHQANMTEPTFVRDANFCAAGKETIAVFKRVKIPESQPSSNSPARDVLTAGEQRITQAVATVDATVNAKRLAIKEGLAKKNGISEARSGDGKR
jgi:hypothetical protein